MNGSIRSVVIDDRAIQREVQAHQKASGPNQIGSPLQGSLSKILVTEGQEVRSNDPLFTIEAMKMESTITAPFNAVVDKIYLKEKTLVNQDDLIVELTEVKED